MNDSARLVTQTFRRALGNFATGVTVVTSRDHEGNWVGVTANSFSSVSLIPPLVLWSLSRTARSLAAFELSDVFIVNVLADNQIDISNRFSRQGLANKFDGVYTRPGLSGCPIILDCLASFQCRKKYSYEGGDHLIFVGEVVDFETADSQGLIFHKGQYAVSEKHPGLNDLTEEAEENSFSESYVDYLLSQTADGFERQYQPILDKYGVSRYEWRVLCCISEYRGVSEAELVSFSLINGDLLRDILAKAAAEDWISSHSDTNGKMLYYIQSAGLDIHVPLLAAARAHESEALATFSDTEVRQLKKMLKNLMHRVNAKGIEVTG